MHHAGCHAGRVPDVYVDAVGVLSAVPARVWFECKLAVPDVGRLTAIDTDAMYD